MSKINSKHVFTSESVSEGHPDKICDQISDAILDACLKQDKDSRVACETLCTTNTVIVSGEITTKAEINYEEIIRKVIREIGYTDKNIGFNADDCEIILKIHKQSPDISQGVTEGEGLFKEQGAGDQGMMFGYASNETPEYMPATILYANKIVEELSKYRKTYDNFKKKLKPDSKSQVSIRYENGKPVAIDTIVVSHQHSEDMDVRWLTQVVKDIVKKVIPSELLNDDIKYYINPTGRFVIGGPNGDTGLCLNEDTIIYTPNGLKKIKELEVGSSVYTEKGTIAKIIEKVNNGERDTRIITDEYGDNIEATFNHPFRVLEDEIKWKECGDLKEGDILLKRTMINTSDKDEIQLNFSEEKLILSRIKKIENGKSNTIDISLDDDTHSFIANGFVVHNTGRKIIVDTYGGVGSHGGGAFCVDGETEYLTPNGWRKMNEYNGELVAQWNNWKMSYEKPLSRIECDADKMYHIYNKFDDMQTLKTLYSHLQYRKWQ